MKRYLPLLISGLLCGLIIALAVRRTSSESAPDGVAEPVPAAPAPAAQDSASNKVLSHDEREQTIARIKELEKMALKKRQQDEAAKSTHKMRAQLQFYKYSAWRKVIDDRRPVFENLREQAAHSPNKMVPCTICDGNGVLDLCVVCDHTGKCPSCRGTGVYFGEVCPTCVGSGKCFLCFGAGKMPCPFCQPLRMKEEGLITPDTPDPLTDLPID